MTGEGKRRGAGFQTRPTGRSAERTGLGGLKPAGPSGGSQSWGSGSGEGRLSGVRLLPPLRPLQCLRSDVRLLQALHRFHVALGLLQDLLGQLLRIHLPRGPRPLLLGLDRAVSLGARLVRLRAANLPFPDPLRGQAGKK